MKEIKKFLEEVGARLSIKNENVLYVEFSDYASGMERLKVVFKLIEDFSPLSGEIVKKLHGSIKAHVVLYFQRCVLHIPTTTALSRVPLRKILLKDVRNKNIFRHLTSVLLGPIPVKEFEADQIISCDAFSFAEHIHDEYYIMNAELTKGKEKNFLKFEGSRFRVFAIAKEAHRKDCPVVENQVSAIRVGGNEIIKFPAADAAKLGINEV